MASPSPWNRHWAWAGYLPKTLGNFEWSNPNQSVEIIHYVQSEVSILRLGCEGFNIVSMTQTKEKCVKISYNIEVLHANK